MQQLAKHWSHRMEVRFDAEEARIAFPNGSVLEMRADPETLDCALNVPDEGDPARMRAVVEEHLNRFAFREGALTFDWRTADAST